MPRLDALKVLLENVSGKYFDQARLGVWWWRMPRWGVEAARAAGMYAVGVGTLDNLCGADVLIRRTSDFLLTQIIHSLVKSTGVE